MINELTDDETFVQSFSRTQSLTSTLNLQLISDDTLDELFFDTDSPLELTHNNLNKVNRRNAMSVSNYIYNLQLPAGVNGRTYSPQLPANPRYSLRQWNNTPVSTAGTVVN
jgi:hypothetical protein